MTDVLRRMQTVQFPLRTFRSSNRCENAGASAGDQLWMDFQAELPEHVVGAELVALATAFELRPPSGEKSTCRRLGEAAGDGAVGRGRDGLYAIADGQKDLSRLVYIGEGDVAFHVHLTPWPS
jgi:hypothetical protein